MCRVNYSKLIVSLIKVMKLLLVKIVNTELQPLFKPSCSCIQQICTVVVNKPLAEFQVSIEYGLSEMMNAEAMGIFVSQVAPGVEKWFPDLAELEAILPVGTIDHSTEPLYPEVSFVFCFLPFVQSPLTQLVILIFQVTIAGQFCRISLPYLKLSNLFTAGTEVGRVCPGGKSQIRQRDQGSCRQIS
jgi:hypothetical protein